MGAQMSNIEHYLQSNVSFILTKIDWYWGLEILEFRL